MTKRSIILLIAVLTIFIITDALAESEKPWWYVVQDESSLHHYEYEVLEDGSASITDFSGLASVINVPEELDGHTVTAISDGAFENCFWLTEVYLPDTIVAIGNSAFYYCRALTKITLPQSLTILGDQAFSFCSELKEVMLPANMTSLGVGLFLGCSSFSTIKVEEGSSTEQLLHEQYVGVNYYLYYVDHDMEYYVYDDGTACLIQYNGTDISIVLPDKIREHQLTVLYHCAFYGCDNLRSITISDCVETVIGNPFVGCLNLSAVSVGNDNSCLATIDGVLFSKRDKTLLWYPATRSDTTYTVPEGILGIGFGAFYACSNLCAITLPQSLTKIDSYAFYACTSMEHLNLPDGLTAINNGAFYYCQSMKAISIPGSVTSIGEDCFAECSSDLIITVETGSVGYDYVLEHELSFNAESHVTTNQDWLN